MYVCYVCQHSLHAYDFGAVIKHLSDHLMFGELRYPIHCRQNQCCSCFKTVNNFMRHYKLYHANGTFSEKGSNCSGLGNATPASDDSDDELELDVNSTSLDLSAHEPVVPLKAVQNEALSLCCMLRSNSAVPYSVVPEVMTACNGMLNSVVDYVVQSLESPNVKSMQDVHQFCDSFKQLQNPVGFLLTQHKQVNAITNHPLFVKPATLVTGIPSIQLVRNKGNNENVPVYKECQYVSVISNLRSLFSNQEFVGVFDQAMSAGVCDPDIITTDVQSTHRFKEHSFYQQSNTVLLQLFYDDMGTTNPLRGASAYHNVGVFYYTIRNLPAYCNSCFPNVHLLALCHSLDIREYGFSVILDNFMQEVHILETQGITVEISGAGSRQLFGTLYQVTCDNLALNALFGFSKSFNSDFFCVHCYATKDEIQHLFRENQFTLRTKMSYEEDCKSAKQCKSTVRGVNAECLLNKSRYFHIMENKTNDCMHTLLEGIVPFEVGCILQKLCNEKLLSLEWLNRKLAILYSKMNMERKNKPFEIVSVHCSGKGISPAMKAVQMWSLLRMLPVVLCELPLQKHPCFLLLIHLCHLTNILFSQSFSHGMIVYLEDIIADHLHMFQNRFVGVALKPKHHFLIHYPNIIRLNGPPMTYSCLRYELKNSFFKRSSHIVCNFRNITLTLAMRHQYNAFFDRLCGKTCRDFIFVNRCENVFVHSLHGSRALCESLNCTLQDVVVVSRSVSYRGKTLRRDSVLVVNNDSGRYLLQIEYFVRSEPVWMIVGRKADIVSFLFGSCAAEVVFSAPVLFDVVRFSDICECEPLDIIKINDRLLVCFKWYVTALAAGNGIQE